MPIMCVRIALLISIAVVSMLRFTQGSIRLDFRQDEGSKLFEVNDTDEVMAKHYSDARVDRSANSADPNISFLAGEDTPVWIAYYADPKNKILLTYRKLEKGIVKQAIDYWKSKQLNGSSKKKRSVDDNMNPLEADRESFGEREDAEDVSSPVSQVPERPKREDNKQVYHPSVLAIMEYKQTWPSDEKDERKLILERIIYALAYWNGVDLQLRPIENPAVRIRLAGIVIGRDRDATHHVYKAGQSMDFLHYEGTVQRLVEYWGDRMRQKIDFQRGTYNVVVLMTDVRRTPSWGNAAVSTEPLTCNHDKPGATEVLITTDNLEFLGLQETVLLMARMLGHGSDNDVSCAYRTVWTNRAWNTCDLKSIQKNLNSNGWCMKDPQEFHDPGKPVQTLLPGMLVSLERQCRLLGLRSGRKLLCEDSGCDALRCQRPWRPCKSYEAPMDGSTCGTGMICLDAQCVNNSKLEHA